MTSSSKSSPAASGRKTVPPAGPELHSSVTCFDRSSTLTVGPREETKQNISTSSASFRASMSHRPKNRRSYHEQNRGYSNSSGHEANTRFSHNNYPGHEAGFSHWRSEPDLHRPSGSSDYSPHFQSSYNPTPSQRWSSAQFAQPHFVHPSPVSSSYTHLAAPRTERSFRSNDSLSSPSHSSATRPGPSMDLQLRTLKVTGFHRDVTRDLLRELFMQVGPVKNVVMRPDFAFIEFADEESVGYALAAMSGVSLFNRPLILEPKVASEKTYVHLKHLDSYLANPEMYLTFT